MWRVILIELHVLFEVLALERIHLLKTNSMAYFASFKKQN